METHKLVPHLFRTEFSKITAVLCRHFGMAYVEVAEDIASETFLSALETWTYKGIPENPTAWLYTVARNKAKNQIRRHQIFERRVSEQVKSFGEVAEAEIDLSDKNITDSQLQMLFAVCHPGISTESQITLALRVLCGFGVDEIANAFITNKETINKRLFRAKEKLRRDKIKVEFPAEGEIANRLDTVLMTLYLLFNEGYYSESQDAIIREELCTEAMRLMRLLIENEQTNQPNVNALFALMCFHSSRFAARRNESGAIILYEDQNEGLWDSDLISQGAYFLKQASQGNTLSRYHLEAAIAYWHTVKNDSQEKWEQILQLYNHLLQLEYSPVAALNRTYALSKTEGKAVAIIEAEKLKLENNHYYFTLLGELYKGTDNQRAREHFTRALSLARTNADKKTIQDKLETLS